MVVLMDPCEDSDNVLRANRSREKTYMFDVALDYTATQVCSSAALPHKRITMLVSHGILDHRPTFYEQLLDLKSSVLRLFLF